MVALFASLVFLFHPGGVDVTLPQGWEVIEVTPIGSNITPEPVDVVREGDTLRITTKADRVDLKVAICQGGECILVKQVLIRPGDRHPILLAAITVTVMILVFFLAFFVVPRYFQ